MEFSFDTKSRQSAKSLFITYDGLLDPLGGSQILPYLRAIASEEDHLHILSFEKLERYQNDAASLYAEFANSSIHWTPLIFTSSWGLIGKVWDLIRMHFTAGKIAYRLRPSVVHARSHAPAQVGLLIKHFFKSRLLFDFRGLWVDERVDKGAWTLANPWHRLQYHYYKHVERRLLRQSDHVVVLTNAVIPEVLRLGVPHRQRVTVIPCCADFSHFQLATSERRQRARYELGIPSACIVLGYLGSVGGMYLPERFIDMVSLAARYHPNLQSLVLTPDLKAFQDLIDRKLPKDLRPIMHMHSADRNHVADWLSAMDILVAFARPSYARISMSPTKLAEAWASGIPSLCNIGVGDVEELVTDLDAGILIDAASDVELQTAVVDLPALINKGGPRLRYASEPRLGLDLATARYMGIYRLLRS